MLEISTPTVGRVASAFSYRRSVTIDRRRLTVRVLETRGWFFTTLRQLRFDDIDHISYAFSSFWTSWDWLGRPHDVLESFTVSLRLKTSEELRVARFFGEGAAGDLSTWLMGDDLIDFAGTQEDESRQFVTTLREMLPVPFGPRTLPPKAGPDGRTWRCDACGRIVAPKPTCLYCGGTTGPSGDAAARG